MRGNFRFCALAFHPEAHEGTRSLEKRMIFFSFLRDLRVLRGEKTFRLIFHFGRGIAALVLCTTRPQIFRDKVVPDSDIPLAEAPRTPSSENLFSSFAPLREIFRDLVGAPPHCSSW